MPSTTQYLKDHVFCRCGQAVSQLVESGLVGRPELISSEVEIGEWWLVSAELADTLRAAGLPMLQFGELNMWGRSAAKTPLKDDIDLINAITAKRP
ncbi:MAG: hypothetical protein KGL90_09230 [Burkholderiales bacterium]|nr:hypothetical protein [Burkholderiales bacterium]